MGSTPPNEDVSTDIGSSTPPLAVESVDERSRKVVTYTIVGLIVILVVVAIAVYTVSRDDDSGDAEALVTSTTSTTAPPTTGTTIDARQKYVGLDHDDRGAGLALGTSIRSIGYTSQSEMQLGDFAYTWVRDGKGDMLWLDRITKAPKNVDPVELQVVAAWDLPAIADDQMLCLGWCSSPKGEPDATVVGLFDGSSNPLKLWRIDAKTPSMNVIPSAGWKLYGDVQEGEEALPMAERPELYGIVALASGEDRATYTALEQVSAGGGASFTPDTFLYPVEDFKENKRAVVLAQGTTVKDIVVTDYISSAEFSLGSSETPHLRYNGKPDGSLIAYISYSGPEKGKIHAAWRIDAATLKITTIDPSKVTEGNP